MIEIKEVKEERPLTHEDFTIALQAMDNACIRTNGQQFLEAAQFIEESADYLLSLNQMLLERLKRIEADRWQWHNSKDFL